MSGFQEEREKIAVQLAEAREEEARLTETTLRPVRRGDGWVVEFALPAPLVENDTHYLLNLSSATGSESARYLFEVRKK